MVKTISLFNHKGGVSKTTTSFNLGWSLAEKGKKILLIDLDSQCNLTGLLLGYAAVDDDKMEAFYSSRKNLTMKPIVEALINGLPPEEFLRNETKNDNGKPLSTPHPSLFLLPGHLDVADLDSQISVSLKIASGIPATRNIPGNLPKILNDYAETQNFDFIIYDLSPNVGGLNEVIVMSSDFFIVPTTPDYFCLQAIGSLEKNIKKWHREIKRFKEDLNFDNRSFPIHNMPLFLGMIQQRYRPRYDKPAKSFEKWIGLIGQAVNEKFVPSLEEYGCVIGHEKIEKALLGSDLKPYDLAHVPDFNSLIAISQQLSKPVFALSDKDIKETGKVFGHAETTMRESRDKFLSIFYELADKVLILTQ